MAAQAGLTGVNVSGSDTQQMYIVENTGNGAAIFDFDDDGLPDVFLVNADRFDRAGPAPTHYLHRNLGGLKFEDATATSGITHADWGQGVCAGDVDNDGRTDLWPDILVANDALPQQLFRNNHNGTFTEAGMTSGLSFDEDGRVFSGMGVSFEDYDNDGRPDVFIGDLSNQTYALFRNDNGLFEYLTRRTGAGAISLLHSAWGAQFLDFDNDGWKDLLVAQSHVMDNIEQTQPALWYREPLLMMRTVRGRFEDVSAGAGEAFRTPMVARCVAFGDLNNDGFMDAVVNCLDGNALILRNQGHRINWIIIDTLGTL